MIISLGAFAFAEDVIRQRRCIDLECPVEGAANCRTIMTVCKQISDLKLLLVSNDCSNSVLD
jgi:hypothetical protein